MTSLPDRPEFHFTPTKGWINDPYGLVFHGGVYHLFFQYVPDSVTWASNCHWGHATSRDLVSWVEQDPAIAPGEDDDGIWSGSLAVDEQRRRIDFLHVDRAVRRQPRPSSAGHSPG